MNEAAPLIAPDETFGLTRQFNRFVDSGDLSRARYLTIGSQILSARETLLREHDSPFSMFNDYSEAIAPELHAYIDTQAQELSADPSLPADMAVRASQLNDLADQLVLLPLLFGRPRQEREAREIKQVLIHNKGMHATHVQHVSAVLDAIHTPSDQPIRVSELIGLLNELTVPALTNGLATVENVTLPALPHEDWYSAQDTVTYYYQGTTPLVVGRQVVSNEARYPKASLRRQAIIGGIALGNSAQSTWWNGYIANREKFRTAELIVGAKNNSVEDPRLLDRLYLLSRKLTNAILLNKAFIKE